jgi:transglutaminase-like putative cysteine protease
MGLPSGRAGLLKTLAVMRDVTNSRAGKMSTLVRQQALALVSGLPAKDYAGEVKELHRFVRDDVRYVRDVRGVETIQTPERTLLNRQGDCDDKATLLSSMLEAVGFKTRFEAIAFQPGQFSHVFPSVLWRDKWVALETTLPGKQPGWRPARVAETVTMGV